jgi:hypothetical protein
LTANLSGWKSPMAMKSSYTTPWDTILDDCIALDLSEPSTYRSFLKLLKSPPLLRNLLLWN